MEFKVKMKKGDALPVANSLRQMAMGKLPAWRPIAFSLDREFNNLRISSDIVEDIVKIVGNLGSLTYIPKAEHAGDFLKEKHTFRGQLRTSTLQSQYFNVVGQDNSLLTSLNDRDVVFTIIYRKASGMMTEGDNADFLVSNGEIKSNYMVMNSRHTDVDNFSYDIADSSLEEETLVFTVNSDTSDGKKILLDAIACMRTALTELENQL